MLELRATKLVKLYRRYISKGAMKSLLYQTSHSNTTLLASSIVVRCLKSMASLLSDDHRLSVIALSYESPTVPMDWVMPISVQRFENVSEVLSIPEIFTIHSSNSLPVR